MPWASVPDVAGVQGSAFTRSQALACGWSNKRLARAVDRGLLVRRHTNVFVLAGERAAVTDDWAALLAAGPRGVVSGWSAARVHDVDWTERPHGPACVWVPHNHHLRLDGVILVRWKLGDTDVELLPDGRVVTARPRTVVDCLRLAPTVLRERMLDTALLRRWLTVDELTRQVHALNGQHGVTSLRRLLRDVGSGARSRAERLAQQVLARTGVVGWEWNVPVRLPDGSTAVLDAALTHLRIAVEIDGRAYHVDADRFQHDRSRQNALVAMGWIVLRFTWWDLTHRPDHVIAVVQQVVASRAA